MVNSANKCIEGVPSFAFVIASKEEMEKTAGISRSLSLDIYDQWEEIGFKCLIDEQPQSPVITSFLYPESRIFNFEKFYNDLKTNGFVIYPGKISTHETFRIGNIGNVSKNDIKRLLDVIKVIKFW